MSHVERLDTASSALFALGFSITKIKHIPNVLFAALIDLSALTVYSSAYLLWLISSFMHQDHSRAKNEWYGFAQFREQYKLSAVLGLGACGMSFFAIFYPELAIPTSWLFLVSNIIWAISEYHKLNNPPPYDQDYSRQRQYAYVLYATALTMISLVGAAAETAALFFPEVALTMYLTSTVFSVITGIQAVGYWCDATFAQETPSTLKKSSYRLFQDTLGIHNPANTSPKPQSEPPMHVTIITHPSKATTAANLGQNADSLVYSPSSK